MLRIWIRILASCIIPRECHSVSSQIFPHGIQSISGIRSRNYSRHRVSLNIQHTALLGLNPDSELLSVNAVKACRGILNFFWLMLITYHGRILERYMIRAHQYFLYMYLMSATTVSRFDPLLLVCDRKRWASEGIAKYSFRFLRPPKKKKPKLYL